MEFTIGFFRKLHIDPNVIVMAGYAIFFSVWNLTAPFAPTTLMLLSAFLIMLSALFFVAYKIYRIFARTIYFRRVAKNQDGNEAEAEIAFNLQSTKVEPWFVVPSILSALSGMVTCPRLLYHL